ncbi:MAG TPA: DUF1080 domain-containing protein [Verrucomicrobiae bacterium]|nr:DUF1080 domain-containing protein [Verrucomicrobiae bacterium]
MISRIFFALLALLFSTRLVAASGAESPKEIELFNGTNFDGFTFCMKDYVDPARTWSVTDGVIHCTGSPSGYLRSNQTFSNDAVTVVWRFVKVAPKKDNTGVLVYLQPPDKVWPVCIQNQGKSGRQGDFFVMSGAECKEHRALGKDANTPVAFKGPANENPVGDWNTNVTLCAGPDVKAVINGKPMNEITGCTISSGAVGIQSEGAEIEIKRISISPLPAATPR